jgi:hypothetical protein
MAADETEVLMNDDRDNQDYRGGYRMGILVKGLANLGGRVLLSLLLFLAGFAVIYHFVLPILERIASW